MLRSIFMNVVELLHKHWNIVGTLSPLPGVNENYLVTSIDGSRVVLKITTEEHADLPLEETVFAHLDAAGFVVPTSRPARDGRSIVKHEGREARVQPFLEGTAWADIGSSPARLWNIGRTIALMHAALETFHDARAERTHEWDLAKAGVHTGKIAFIEDASLRAMIEACFAEYEAAVLPKLALCPRGVLHGDVNDENVLISGDEVVGVLDVGDCHRGALVEDLAVALASACRHEGGAADSLVDGYEDVRPLTLDERSVLKSLTRVRLATILVVAAATGESFSHLEQTPAAFRSLGLQQRRSDRLAPSLSLSYDKPLHIVRGRGAYLFDADNRSYLDLVNNVCHVGHCHPAVVAAIAEQAAVLNTNTRYLHETVLAYGERLCSMLPKKLDTCIFVNSGSEANELALRLARSSTGAHDALVIDGAYHGNTSSCIAMSPYKFNGRGGAGPSDWVHVAPMPDLYRGEIRDDGRAYALELACVIGEACTNGRSIAAFFAEPILSCGGQIPLPEGYLAAAFAHVRSAGGLCIADEVQVGFGRVGHSFWAFEQHDVVPDIVVMGKPMGNGHPIGAVVTTRDIAEAFNNGMEYFSTFGGNPVSAACGLAVLDVIEREGLQANALTLGQSFRDGLHELAQRHALIGDVRGEGLFLGVELVRDRTTLEPAAAEAHRLVNAIKARGVLLSVDGPLNNVLKIKPPLAIVQADVDTALSILDDELSRLETSSC